MKKKQKEFYIVDKKILPTSIQKVIEVNELIEVKKISKYEAIKKIGISRSTYYKYKDYIKPFFEETSGSVFNLFLTLEDSPGILSSVLNLMAKSKLNILTIIQNIPINGKADITISIQVKKEVAKEMSELLEKIKSVNGVENIRIIGNN